MPRPTARLQQGFSLVEALISVLVLSVGLTGIARFQIHSWRSSLDGARLGGAMHLASERLDQLRVRLSLSPGIPAAGSDSPATTHTRYERRWQLLGNTDRGILVRVTLSWQSGRRNDSLALQGFAQSRHRNDDGLWVARHEQRHTIRRQIKTVHPPSHDGQPPSRGGR